MRERIICATKDSDGDILTIGNGQRTWTRAEAVSLINTYGVGAFYVQQPGTQSTDIHVYAAIFVRTDPDGDPRNNLDNLVACSLYA